MALPSPSPFSVLLRRSKFASFDPAVSQVYRTYDGDAFRGNWGLKRPLALRRRTAMIVVSSVDSRYQQTEWRSGETEARFVRKFEELNIDFRFVNTPEMHWNRMLVSEMDSLDSDFSRDVRKDEEDLRHIKEFSRSNEEDKIVHWSSPYSCATPNIHAMSDKQFRRYLEKLRKLRPEFQAFVKETDEIVRGGPSKDRRLRSIGDHPRYPERFIQSKAWADYHSPQSRNIEPRPHSGAGLIYWHPPPMQTLLTTPLRPAIILQDIDKGNRLASFAGMKVRLMKNLDQHNKVALFDFRPTNATVKDPVNSVTMVRFSEMPKFKDPPVVVGGSSKKSQYAAVSDACVYSKEPGSTKDIPAPPGSREYIAHEKPRLPFRPRIDLFPNTAKEAMKNEQHGGEARLLIALHNLNVAAGGEGGIL